MIKLVNIYSMKKSIDKKHNKIEPWFKWLMREINSHEAFQDFASGKNPEDVAEAFISKNRISISEFFDDVDEDDKDTLDQFFKLIACEWHVFRILLNQIESRNNIRNLDFQKRKRLKS